MRSRQTLARALAGTGLVMAAAGYSTALHAGEGATIGEGFAAGGYRLVWADEFDADGALNPRNWVFEKGFVRNNEDQWCQAENARCRNGQLYITGIEDIKRNPGYVKGSTDPKERKFIEWTTAPPRRRTEQRVRSVRLRFGCSPFGNVVRLRAGSVHAV
ncbi:MAG: hypothetical protein ACYTKD_08765 [Planctomycetota bacterium]|jgi:hypothetical protein